MTSITAYGAPNGIDPNLQAGGNTGGQPTATAGTDNPHPKGSYDWYLFEQDKLDKQAGPIQQTKLGQPAGSATKTEEPADKSGKQIKN